MQLVAYFQMLDIEIAHIPGKDINAADALSILMRLSQMQSVEYEKDDCKRGDGFEVLHGFKRAGGFDVLALRTVVDGGQDISAIGECSGRSADDA